MKYLIPFSRTSPDNIVGMACFSVRNLFCAESDIVENCA